MELYDNTVDSFHDFIDLYFTNGRSEEGLVKNTFKYAFDGETEERFLHLYFDYQDEAEAQASQRIKYLLISTMKLNQ